MNKWLKALKLDVVGQEHKSPLTDKEKQIYTFSMAMLFFALSILNMFAAYPYVWLVSIGLFAVGARKFQIWLHKRGVF